MKIHSINWVQFIFLSLLVSSILNIKSLLGYFNVNRVIHPEYDTGQFLALATRYGQGVESDGSYQSNPHAFYLYLTLFVISIFFSEGSNIVLGVVFMFPLYLLSKNLQLLFQLNWMKFFIPFSLVPSILFSLPFAPGLNYSWFWLMGVYAALNYVMDRKITSLILSVLINLIAIYSVQALILGIALIYAFVLSMKKCGYNMPNSQNSIVGYIMSGFHQVVILFFGVFVSEGLNYRIDKVFDDKSIFKGNRISLINFLSGLPTYDNPKLVIQATLVSILGIPIILIGYYLAYFKFKKLFLVLVLIMIYSTKNKITDTFVQSNMDFPTILRLFRNPAYLIIFVYILITLICIIFGSKLLIYTINIFAVIGLFALYTFNIDTLKIGTIPNQTITKIFNNYRFVKDLNFISKDTIIVDFPLSSDFTTRIITSDGGIGNVYPLTFWTSSINHPRFEKFNADLDCRQQEELEILIKTNNINLIMYNGNVIPGYDLTCLDELKKEYEHVNLPHFEAVLFKVSSLKNEDPSEIIEKRRILSTIRVLNLLTILTFIGYQIINRNIIRK
jgi:hypothetical protein